MSLFAYIDPGSGSLLLQAILAAIVSIPFFFRRTIGGAIGRLRGRSHAEPPADPDAASRPDVSAPPDLAEPPER